MSKKPSKQTETSESQSIENKEKINEGANDQAEMLTELQTELEEAKTKAEENWDRALRIQAEMENLKRRSERDVANAHKFALEGFAQELLAVVDSLEQAQATIAPEATDDGLSQGVEMTLALLLKTLNQFSIEQIDPQGESFDPTHHEAMSMQPAADVVPNTVLAVIQKGYILNGRLIRPARVIVAKAVDTPGVDEKV